MFVNTVISGGQTGADQAGLVAAVSCGIRTGGWAPRNWRTLTGPNPQLGTIFGLKEHSGGYKERTWSNVEESSGTIRFAIDFNSPGEWCTLNAIKHFKKPYLDINLNDWEDFNIRKVILRWLIDNHIEILNVAGNTERQVVPSIFYRTKIILQNCFNYQLWTDVNNPLKEL